MVGSLAYCARQLRALVRRPLLPAALIALGAGLTGPAAAQDVLKINPVTVSAILNGGEGQPRPQLVENPLSSTGFAISPIRMVSWAEFPFSVTNPGAYGLAVEYATSSFQPVIAVDIRKAGTNQHIATADITLTATAGGAFNNRSIAGFSAPLSAGDYVLRVQNVSGGHFTVAQGHGSSTKDLAIGSATLTRTAALPILGTLTGVVNSDLGFPVEGAWVFAVAPGAEIAEPGPFWYKGFWTVTDSQGKYTLVIPAGSYVVQAGRPDSYDVAGAKTGTLSLPAAGLTAPALQLTARRDFEGTVTVESEYYNRKNPDTFTSDGTGLALMGLVGTGGASNGYKLGFVDPGDWVEVHVDVAATGWYTLTSYYFNGCGSPGVMRYTSDKGSSTQGSQPPTGDWIVQGSVPYAKPIYLYRGHNIIRQYSVTGCSDMDAFSLTPGASPPGDVLRLEAEEFTVSGGGSAASPGGGSSGTVVDAAAGTDLGKDFQTISGAVVGFWSSFGQGNFDVGGQTWDAPEYLEYTLDAGQDGMYSMNVRGAFVGLSLPVVLRVWNLSYGPIVDESFLITNENSGGYAAGSMNQFAMPVEVPLKAGPNRMRIYLFGGLNADWFEFTRTGPLTGMGVVSGQVTANGQPVANAQVSSTASVTPATSPVPLGTRAITNAQGGYSLLLPVGSQTISADALGLSANPITVSVDAATPPQDFALTVNNKYEGEWWTYAWQSIPASGHGLSAVDLADASQGQTVGYFDVNTGSEREKEYIDYAVMTPTAGVYNVTLRYRTDDATPEAGIPLLVQAPGTGASIAVTIPKSGILTDYAIPVGVPLTAGTPILRFTNNSAVKGSLNLDYFTLAATGQGLANLKGTVTSAANGQVLGGATVVVTSGDTVVATATTPGGGTYAFSLPAGSYTVTVSAPGYETQSKPATLVVGTNPALDFSMVGGRLRGTVKDAGGQPVPNTAVLITSAEGLTVTVLTDAAGAFDTVASLGTNTVMADVTLSVTEPFVYNITTDSQAEFIVRPLTDGTPLALTYDQDWFTTNTEQAGTDRDTFHTVSGWYALPAEEAPGFGAATFPATVTLGGLPFLAGDPNGTALNVLSLLSPVNTIDMPDDVGLYKAAILVLATDGGEVRGTATVHYKDGSSTILPFYAPEWFAGWTSQKLGPKTGFSFAQNAEYPIYGAAELFRFTHRHVFDLVNGDGDGRGSYEFRFYSHVLQLDPTKQLDRIMLPEDVSGLGASPNPFLWAVTLAGQSTPPVKLSSRALKIAGGLEAAPASNSADFAAMNVVTSGDSQTRIDILDAVRLTQQGM